jgi:predicted SAM-dependent methyltransferase
MKLIAQSASILDKCGVGPFLRPAVRCIREQRNHLARIPSLLTRRSIIESYFRQNALRKLHLGASDKILAGWLNSDLEPGLSECIFLDATKRFPFTDDSFDYVFCEHFVEHLNPEGATVCFREVFRCLRQGGVFRVATPNLQKYVNLFKDTVRSEEKDFLSRFGKFFKLGNVSPCVALNHIFYNWGHCFLYTQDELFGALKRAGFEHVISASVGESRHDALRGIERHWKFYGVEMNEYETLVMEASK